MVEVDGVSVVDVKAASVLGLVGTTVEAAPASGKGKDVVVAALVGP